MIEKQVLDFFMKARFLKFLKKAMANAFFYMLKVVYFSDTKGSATVFKLIKKIKSETKMALNDIEAYYIYLYVKKTEKIKGEIAEVGVYKGGSAKLICEAKGKRELYLFDTFEGLPETGSKDSSFFRKGVFSYSMVKVKRYLAKYKNVHIYRGIFPKTAIPIKEKKFSFVHLDVDIYDSTKDSLGFFYPRMERGGIIISHDYRTAAGVKAAINEFFKDKDETVIELFGSQCMIIKL